MRIIMNGPSESSLASASDFDRPLEAQGVSGRCLAVFPVYLVSEAEIVMRAA